MKIPFFPYKDLYLQNSEEYKKIFNDVCSRGAYILQKDLEEFEEQIKKFIGVKYAFGVANGTDALILGAKAIGISRGDEVIMPSHTYIASPASIYLLGGSPILTECGEDGMMDPEDIAKRITKNTKAIMPVHINGRTCDMDRIFKISEEHNIPIIEDAAQGLGSKFKGVGAGTFGLFGTISFYPAKLLGCFGDGGLVMTNDDEIAEKLSLLRDHGRDGEGNVIEWGYNSRLDNLQAAFLNFKLKNFVNDINKRRTLAKKYHERLKNQDGLILPPPPCEGKHFDVFQNYEVQAQERDELKAYLEKKGVASIIQWAGTPVHQFKKLGFNQELPKTDNYFKNCLMLPMNVSLTEEKIDFISNTIIDFYE